MTSAEIRQTFIDYFLKLDHKFVPSAPVVPLDDPTLLFINAGMNQFKDIFLGTGTRDYTRAANSQKVIRVSGKHNDLEEVGPSPIHHTFFEMLGNWSFGDYYKAEAIRWAWDLMTEVYKLDKSKLYATVFAEDDEAHRLWETETDMDPSHISRHGHKDNFWEMGDTGPCGPCSELHYDLGKPLPGRVSGPDDGPNTDSGRYIELWNLVFIQYFRDKTGKLNPLPATHVDTGAGLERIARVMQGGNSNYSTDLFKPIIEAIENETGVPYKEDGLFIPHRVIADHLRSLSFAIADGALPSNEGRGYVLRRILRRAARFSRELGVEGPFLCDLVPVLVDNMSDHFSELKVRQQHIQHVLRSEEESFGRTLNRGLEVFRGIHLDKRDELHNDSAVQDWINSMTPIFKEHRDFPAVKRIRTFLSHLSIDTKNFHQLVVIDKDFSIEDELRLLEDRIGKTMVDAYITNYRKILPKLQIPGEEAFKLYDTYGFPLDLTELLARERSLFVDEAGFNEAMEQAKEKSREASKFVAGDVNFDQITKGDHSKFTGYEELKTKAEVRFVREVEDSEEKLVEVVLSKTPFYAESGGQASDIGKIVADNLELDVVDVRQDGDLRVHVCKVKEMPEDFPVEVTAKVDTENRRNILPHHTTTHLLQAALRKVIGTHVTQAGSKVGPDYMTFDFTHFEKLTPEQLRKVEDYVNQWIREDHKVSWDIEDIETAKSRGAMALFGEKYGEEVRVITIGLKDAPVSLELCGGTHLNRTGEAGLFRIESEAAVSAGVRRMTCTAGKAAYLKSTEERRLLAEANSIIGNQGYDPTERLNKLMERQKTMEKEIEKLKRAALQGSVNFIEDWGREIDSPNGKIMLISGVYDAATDRDALQAAADKIIEDLNKAKIEGIGVVAADLESTFMIVSVVTPGLVKNKISAGKIVGAVAKKAGGGGGGKPNFATAGSKDKEKANATMRNIDLINKIVAEVISD